MNVIYLKDYRSPAFDVESVPLNFPLFEDGASVIAKQVFKKLDTNC